jgi:signal peptidase I
MPNIWFACVITFLIPPLGFVYLSKWKLSSIYLLALVIARTSDIYLFEGWAYLLLSLSATAHIYDICSKEDLKSLNSWNNKLLVVLSVPVGLFGAVFFSKFFLFDYFYIPSNSMVPTLNVGDNIIVSKWGYGNYGAWGLKVHSPDYESRDKPKRGEVFVFEQPGNQAVRVSRIIGLPGDDIAFSNKRLVINDNRIPTEENLGDNYFVETLDDETYNIQYSQHFTSDAPSRTFNAKVPNKSYFVMGDSRDSSNDSRYWGFVPEENIIGKVTDTY